MTCPRGPRAQAWALPAPGSPAPGEGSPHPRPTCPLTTVLSPQAKRRPYYADYSPAAPSTVCAPATTLDLFITFIIGVNVITMSMEHYSQPKVGLTVVTHQAAPASGLGPVRGWCTGRQVGSVASQVVLHPERWRPRSAALLSAVRVWLDLWRCGLNKGPQLPLKPSEPTYSLSKEHPLTYDRFHPKSSSWGCPKSRKEIE